jgi:predicted cation transporter
MLIPGNIPNIISGNKLGITSKEWARLGVPLGLVLMALFFVWISACDRQIMGRSLINYST